MTRHTITKKDIFVVGSITISLEAIDCFQEGYVNAVEGVQDEVGLIILDLKLPKA